MPETNNADIQQVEYRKEINAVCSGSGKCADVDAIQISSANLLNSRQPLLFIGSNYLVLARYHRR